jgi:hypothetical protein
VCVCVWVCVCVCVGVCVCVCVCVCVLYDKLLECVAAFVVPAALLVQQYKY